MSSRQDMKRLPIYLNLSVESSLISCEVAEFLHSSKTKLVAATGTGHTSTLHYFTGYQSR